MNATDLVERLDGVRQTGPGRWIARCPAHEDKSPSLSVREGDTGAVLLHCFAGCDVHAVTAALGVTVTDLFPDRPADRMHERQRREPFNARDVLACVSHELTVALVVMRELEAGEPLTAESRERLALACRRVASAAELVNA